MKKLAILEPLGIPQDKLLALVEEAVDSLAQAKAMHDRLEALYNPYVDFDLVEETARQIGDEILNG